MFDYDFIALLPEIFLINATIILLIFGVLYSADASISAFYRAHPRKRPSINVLLGSGGSTEARLRQPRLASYNITRLRLNPLPGIGPGFRDYALSWPVLRDRKRLLDRGPGTGSLASGHIGGWPIGAHVHHRPIVCNVAWLAFLSIFLTIMISASAAKQHSVLCYNNLIIDNFTFYLKVGALACTGCILLMSLQYEPDPGHSPGSAYPESAYPCVEPRPPAGSRVKPAGPGSTKLPLRGLREGLRPRMRYFESIILILMSTCSMLFMISAFDLIAMYLAIELQSLCFYVLAASKRNSEFSTEAGLKYFILGAFSSGILLFGCSLIYGFTGLTNLEELAKIFTTPLGSFVDSQHDIRAFESGPGSRALGTSSMLSSRMGPESRLPGLASLGPPMVGPILTSTPMAPSSGIFMGILFLAVGFLFKITAVPFHMWAPDVYEGSPTIVTAFFSVAPKIAILANMLRVFMYSFYDPTWQQLFVFCSVASMILGAFAALSQNKVKRLLAFSSIGHIGYLLIGFSCGTIEGIQSLLIGLFIYVFMTINIFTVILALRPGSGSRRSGSFKYISDLGALAKTNPILAITISITMFSLAGIPPLAGFCSKFYLFFAALGCGAFLLALVGIITSVISCFYYIRLVKIMYFDSPKTWAVYGAMDREKSILLGITIFFITFFFLYPSPLFLVTHKMALTLCL